MPISRQRWWRLAAAVVIAAGAVLAWHWHEDAAHTDGPHTLFKPLAGWFETRPQPAVAEASSRAASTPGEAPPFNPLDTTALPTFRATPQGALVIDVQTRNDIERMVALFANDKGQQRLDIQSADLPAQARQELRDLYQRYLQYSQALSQAIPPNQSTLDDATRQLQIVHDLRQQYFGESQAQAMFGAEEATASELLDLMRKQTDPKASLDERAAQAQTLWKQAHPDGAAATTGGP